MDAIEVGHMGGSTVYIRSTTGDRVFGRRQIVAGLAALTSAAALSGTGRAFAASHGLHAAALKSGRYFGTATRIEHLQMDSVLANELATQCGWITPEVHLKWSAIEPEQGNYRFRPIDRLIELANNNGLNIHGHTLIWERSTPEWALEAMARYRDWALVDKHIGTVLQRFSNIRQWDVVNEPIDNYNGIDGIRQNTFTAAFGEQYIAQALISARNYAPEAKLMINDYGFEYDHPVQEERRLLFLRLLERLKKADVPLDGVGLQAHLNLAHSPINGAVLRPFLKNLADFGLDIAITELDVNEYDFGKPLEQRDMLVADEVKRFLDVVLDYRALKGVTTWGLTDRHSWLRPEDHDSYAEGGRGSLVNRGLPYDLQMLPKAMYRALLESFSGA